MNNPVQEICSVWVEMYESRECVQSKLAARRDGLGRHELLDAAGTLLKGCKSFFEICILPAMLLRNSILNSNL